MAPGTHRFQVHVTYSQLMHCSSVAATCACVCSIKCACFQHALLTVCVHVLHGLVTTVTAVYHIPAELSA
jgi:hypothetical protein